MDFRCIYFKVLICMMQWSGSVGHLTFIVKVELRWGFENKLFWEISLVELNVLDEHNEKIIAK